MRPPPDEPTPDTSPPNIFMLVAGASALLLLAWQPVGSLVKHGLGPALVASVAGGGLCVVLWWRVISPAFLERRLRDDRDRIHALLAERLASAQPERREQTRREVLGAERDDALLRARSLAQQPTRAISSLLTDRIQSAFIAFIALGVLTSPMLLILGPYSIGIFLMLLGVIALCILCVFGVGACAAVMKQNDQQQEVLRVTRHVATIDELSGGLSLSEGEAGQGELEVAAQHGGVELVAREAPERH